MVAVSVADRDQNETHLLAGECFEATEHCDTEQSSWPGQLGVKNLLPVKSQFEH